MQGDYELLARDFLASLSEKEKVHLYNDLLALKTVHMMNQNSTYYTFKNLKRAVRKYSERRKRSFHYINDQSVELLIHQIHEQHFFKNAYRIEIYLNSNECSYAFVESLLTALQAPAASSVHYQEILA